MKRITLYWQILFLFIILHLTFNVEMNAQSSFNFKKYLFDSLSTLSLFVDSINSSNGYVKINGGDSRCPTNPFDWYWGDGDYSSGFFPLSHTYENTEKNYIVKVIANYSSGWKDTAELLIRFVPPSISPITLSDTISVYIPDHPISLGSRPFPGYGPPSLASFNNSFFTAIPRASLEYILSVSADIQMDFVNHNTYLFENKFEQYMLRDSLFGGAYSLWFTNPVAFGVGDVFMLGNIGYSSLFHEMGHNITLNTPGTFYFGGRIDGNANAIYSETMAQIFQHSTGYVIVNNYLDYGLSEDIMSDIKQQVIQTIKFVRFKYEEYCNSGYPYSSWNNPATPEDETFLSFMTIAYKFFEHAENSGNGYLVPLKRMMTFLQGFCQNWSDSYDHNNNTAAADSFRATLFVKALSVAFQTDLRSEFRDLHFPVSDQIYNAFTNPVIMNITAVIEGLYNNDSNKMVSDTVTVELNNSTFPYELVESKKGVLNSSGMGTFIFSSVVNNTPYYIVIKHRNGVETWSATGKSFVSDNLSYNFTTSQTQAFGSNLIHKGTKWCIYSGDVNQDGLVDSGDLASVDNDNSLYVTGYTVTDVNGDGIVDSGDLAITDNNNSLYVGKIVPAMSHAAKRVNKSLKVKNNKQ
jgi:hypothetical protein